MDTELQSPTETLSVVWFALLVMAGHLIKDEIS